MELSIGERKWRRQYVISKNAKANMRRQRSALDVGRSNLFPDLANLAAELKNQSAPPDARAPRISSCNRSWVQTERCLGAVGQRRIDHRPSERL
jgi:hypothetical protein